MLAAVPFLNLFAFLSSIVFPESSASVSSTADPTVAPAAAAAAAATNVNLTNIECILTHEKDKCCKDTAAHAINCKKQKDAQECEDKDCAFFCEDG